MLYNLQIRWTIYKTIIEAYYNDKYYENIKTIACY